jgi:hypothetical protein
MGALLPTVAQAPPRTGRQRAMLQCIQSLGERLAVLEAKAWGRAAIARANFPRRQRHGDSS